MKRGVWRNSEQEIQGHLVLFLSLQKFFTYRLYPFPFLAKERALIKTKNGVKSIRNMDLQYNNYQPSKALFIII
jgi:hypothetical protein